MMEQVFILKIRDHSDFGAVRHESAHPTEAAAWTYADHFALPAVQEVTDAEWHSSLDCTVAPMEFFE